VTIKKIIEEKKTGNKGGKEQENKKHVKIKTIEKEKVKKKKGARSSRIAGKNE
jgi:hypothetical protein